MNENLEKQLAKVIEKSLSLAEKTGEFVIDQAPDLLREFYAWHITLNSVNILISVLCFYAGFNIFKLWSKKYTGQKYDDLFETVFRNRLGDPMAMYMPFIIFNLLGLILFIVSIIELLQILVAPKIYLIEYFIK